MLPKDIELPKGLTVKRRQAVVAELHRIYQDGGGVLEAKAVLVLAANPDNVLHSYFEWDDTVAAGRYRLEQARDLIRTVTVKFTIEKMILKLPCYVPDQTRLRAIGGYTLITAVTTTDARKATIIQELDAAVSHLQRAGNIARVLDNGKVHRTILKKVTEVGILLDFIRGLDLVKKPAVKQAAVRIAPSVAAKRI